MLVGGIVGLTGMGGGSLMTPLLVLVFGINPSLAVGTDIFHGAVFKTVGAIQHRRLGNVQARLSAWMFVGSAPMSLAGVAVATWIKHRYGGGVDSAMGTVLGTALLFGGAGLVAKSLVHEREVSNRPFRLSARDRVAGVSIGLFGGFIVGLTSVGSGTFFALTMLIVFPLRAHKVVGTDIFHAAALLWVAGAGHLVAGNVDPGVVAWLLVGSIPGVLLASQFAVRVPERLLRFGLASVLILSGVKMLDVPNSNVVAAAGVAAVGGVLVIAAIRTRMQQRPVPVVDRGKR
ncbi:MAG: sulfite exporter TauE/SafE family protein [Chloroflexota bacterium]|nr:sulfite exporter TauE/SafE family protein [Chloroflexota bacterium]